VARAKPKIESGVAPYTAARAAFETFVFSEAGRGSAQAETRTALSGNNEDVALVTNDLRAPEQALIDQWDQQVVRLQDSRTITGNARNLRKQYEGMLRSSNGLKYMFASGFRLQMQQVIASASTDPVRLRGVEVSVGDRRADYTEWMVGDLRLVVEVKNWTGQSRWTPEKTVELVNELFAQVADHLYAVRDADGHPLGGVRVEIRGGYPARLESLWPALEAHAAALPTVIPNRPKTLVRVVLP